MRRFLSNKDGPNKGADMLFVLIAFKVGILVGIFILSLIIMRKGSSSEDYRFSEIEGPSLQTTIPTASTTAA